MLYANPHGGAPAIKRLANDGVLRVHCPSGEVAYVPSFRPDLASWLASGALQPTKGMLQPPRPAKAPPSSAKGAPRFDAPPGTLRAIVDVARPLLARIEALEAAKAKGKAKAQAPRPSSCRREALARAELAQAIAASTLSRKP